MSDYKEVELVNSQFKRDDTVWTKSSYEKKLLKKAKRVFGNYEFSAKWGYNKRAIPCYGKLIVQIKKNENFLGKMGYHYSHMTFSFKCGQSNITEILNKFISDTGESLVIWYKWNGKQYQANELPFYYW